MNWPLLQNSLLVALLTTALAAGFGFVAALFLAGVETRRRHWLLALALASLAMPPFLVTNCWLDLLGETGALHCWLPLKIYSLGGTVWILALLTWPISLLATLTSWQRLEPSQLESEPALQGALLIRWLLWPMARIAVGLAAALTFVLALNNFAVPAILQVKVAPSELWVSFNTNLDSLAALRIGWPLMAAPVVLLLLLRCLREPRWPRLEGGVGARLFRRQLGRGWFVFCGGITVLLVVLSFGIPVAQLVAAKRTWLELLPSLAAGTTALTNTVLNGAVVATMTVAAGLAWAGWKVSCSIRIGAPPTNQVLAERGRSPSAAGGRVSGQEISRDHATDVRAADGDRPRSGAGEESKTGAPSTRCGWCFAHSRAPFSAHIAALRLSSPGNRIARSWSSALLCLPLFIPGIFLGLALIWALNRPGLDVFYRSAGVVLLALAIRYLGPAWFGAGLAMRSVDRDLIDSARLEGAGGWALFRLVHWPQIAPQVAAVWYVVFLLCLWDVETIVLVLPPGGETLALRIFNLLHYGHSGQVNALCVWLLVVAVLPLVGWRLAGKLSVISDQLSVIGRAVLAGLVVIASWAGCTPRSSSQQAPVNSQFFSHVEIIGSRGAGAGEFNKPRSVAVDRNDNLFVVDMTGRVQKFSPEGKFLLHWQMPQTDLGKAKGMSLDRDGNVVVLEPHYQRVNHFSPDGKLVAQWGGKGTNAGQFSLPRAVAVNSRNEVIVSEYTLCERVQVFAALGKKLLGEFGHAGTGPGEFNRPEGVGVDSADRIYVADSCNHRIQVFSAEGKFLRAYGKAGSGPGEFSYPYNIRVDAGGRQFVCEFGNNRIQIFDANDQPLEILGGAGAAPGQFANPWGIAFDSKGNLFVADSQNHRVQKFVRKPALARNDRTE